MIRARRALQVAAVALATGGVLWLVWPRPDAEIRVERGGRAVVANGADSSDGASLQAGGDVTVTADSDLNALMIAGAVGVGSDVGLGLASTVLVHLDTVEARVGDHALVEAAGSILEKGVMAR